MQVLSQAGDMRWVVHSVPENARVVCLSDIHGNRAALEAVWTTSNLDQAELVVMHGDLVNRGPCSDVVWDMCVSEPRWRLISGNHERYVRNHLIPGAAPQGRWAEIHSTSAWTCRKLGTRARGLFDWPDGVILQSPGLPEIRVVHASLLGDDRGVGPGDSPKYQRMAAEGLWSLLVVGHIHRCYDFWAGTTQVLNAGSVGSASDGVHQAGWVELRALPTGWSTTIHRIPYDEQRADDDFYHSGFLSEGGPTARLIYREWQLARPVIRPWFERYVERVLQEELSIEKAVSDYLEELDEDL